VRARPLIPPYAWVASATNARQLSEAGRSTPIPARSVCHGHALATSSDYSPGEASIVHGPIEQERWPRFVRHRYPFFARGLLNRSSSWPSSSK